MKAKASYPASVLRREGEWRASPVGYSEPNIELLFRERLAERCGIAPPLTATASLSTSEMRKAWRHISSHMSFDCFAELVAEALSYAYDAKYGRWNDENDLRTIYPESWDENIICYIARLGERVRALGVGVNDGREIRRLFADKSTCLDVVDMSGEAMERLGVVLGDYVNCRRYVGRFEHWRPTTRSYDIFFSLRTVQCTAVDRRAFVGKAISLVRSGGTLIFSIADGYKCCDGGVARAIRGLYSHDMHRVEGDRSWEIAIEVTQMIIDRRARLVAVLEGATEIFLVAEKVGLGER